MSNEDLRFGVAEEVFWELCIIAEAIVVSVDQGLVTLRGSVGTAKERLRAQGGSASAAVTAAQGVVSVDDRIRAEH